MRINLDVYESIYTYDDLKDTLDLKRIAIYTRNDERDLQEMVCKDFFQPYMSCIFRLDFQL